MKSELNVLKYGYLPLTYWKNWGKNIRQFFRNIKYACQRITKGFCDQDVWDLDVYYSELFYYTLKSLSDITISHPCSIEYEDWKALLNEMAEHFMNCQEWCEDTPMFNKVMGAYDEVDKHIIATDFEECHDEMFGTTYRMIEKYDDEDAYNKAKDYWLECEKEASEFRTSEKNKAIDMLKEHFYSLWD